MSSLTPATEEIAEKRIGMTLLIHGILLLGSSAIPEEDFLIWFPINLVIEALIIIQLLRMWKRYKNKPQHYYTIQVYWMLIGLSFFAMLPIVKIMYYTASFWPVLVLTVLLFFYARFIQGENSGSVRESKEKKTASSLACIFVHSCFYRNTHQCHSAC